MDTSMVDTFIVSPGALIFGLEASIQYKLCRSGKWFSSLSFCNLRQLVLHGMHSSRTDFEKVDTIISSQRQIALKNSNFIRCLAAAYSKLYSILYSPSFPTEKRGHCIMLPTLQSRCSQSLSSLASAFLYISSYELMTARSTTVKQSCRYFIHG